LDLATQTDLIRGASSRKFSPTAARSSKERPTAVEMLNAAIAELESFRGGMKSAEDITLVIIKVQHP